jgi:DNA-binding MarR family transcriptional regulator
MKRVHFTSLEKRLAFFLINEPTEEPNILTLMHKEIAMHVGCTREAVTRALDILEKAEYIKLGRKISAY